MGTEETKQNTAEQVQTSQGATDTASKETAEASEGKTEAKTIPITETPEFKAALDAAAIRLAQSLKDKELKPLYERLNQAERERKAEREARESVERQQKEEVEINNLYEGLIEEGVSEEAAATFRDKALKLSQDLVKKGQDYNTAVEHYTQEKNTFDEEAKGLTVVKSTVKVLDIAEAQGKTLKKSEAERIAKESEGNLKLIEYMVKVSGEQTEKLPVRESKRPDSGLNSAAGGSKSDTEIVQDFNAGRISNATYEAECKKRNLDPVGGFKKSS